MGQISGKSLNTENDSATCIGSLGRREYDFSAMLHTESGRLLTARSSYLIVDYSDEWTCSVSVLLGLANITHAGKGNRRRIIDVSRSFMHWLHKRIGTIKSTESAWVTL